MSRTNGVGGKKYSCDVFASLAACERISRRTHGFDRLTRVARSGEIYSRAAGNHSGFFVTPEFLKSALQQCYMRPYFLESARVGFSTWREDDLPLAAALWGDAEVTRYHGGAWSPQQVQDRLALEIETLRQWQMQYWPIFQLTTGEHIGCCGLHPRDAPHGIWELGCHLRRAFWSRRLGREAALAVIEHAFREPRFEALFAGHHPLNTASRNFLRHLGFHHTHDEFYAPTQVVEPCYLLTRRERAHFVAKATV